MVLAPNVKQSILRKDITEEQHAQNESNSEESNNKGTKSAETITSLHDPGIARCSDCDCDKALTVLLVLTGLGAWLEELHGIKYR
jgi:hypothetical protein